MFIFMYMDKETKYRESALKAQKAYRERQKQKKLDKKTAETIRKILDMVLFEKETDWPETLKVLNGTSK